MTVRFAQWTLDVHDVERMLAFWSAALGYDIDGDHLRPPRTRSRARPPSGCSAPSRASAASCAGTSTSTWRRTAAWPGGQAADRAGRPPGGHRPDRRRGVRGAGGPRGQRVLRAAPTLAPPTRSSARDHICLSTCQKCGQAESGTGMSFSAVSVWSVTAAPDARPTCASRDRGPAPSRRSPASRRPTPRPAVA